MDNVWNFDTPVKVGFLPDTHWHPGGDERPTIAAARWFAEHEVDVVVNAGDANDMGSLSSYDKGKASIEGKRLQEELDYSRHMLQVFEDNLQGHEADLILTLGNHEHRLDRHQNDNPELSGAFGNDPFGYEEFGYWVYPYQQPVEINGVYFSHNFRNPHSAIGSVQGGTAEIRMKNLGITTVCGHTHGKLVYGKHYLPTGKAISALMIGCYHTERHGYWGKGTGVYAGAAILDNLWEGDYDLNSKDIHSLLRDYT